MRPEIMNIAVIIPFINSMIIFVLSKGGKNHTAAAMPNVTCPPAT